MSEVPRPHVIVLGAGVCGLYTARTLVDQDVEVTLVERLDTVGGLAAGYEINGNYYDVGVHHLHMFDKEIFEDILSIVGDRMHPVELNAKVKHGNGFRKYPLEFADLLLGIPPWTLSYCVSGLLKQQLQNKIRQPEPQNAEEALIQLYGRPLYNYFFKDFTHRYWGIPPTQLSATFVKRKMPRLSAVDVIKNWLSKLGVQEDEEMTVESAVRKETLYFSNIGASMMPTGIAEYIRENGGRVVLDAEVTSVQTNNDQITGITYEQEGVAHALECDACISTIPINVLARIMQPQPPEPVVAATEFIRYKAIAVYGFLVNREHVFDETLYTYFRDRSFHRISEPKNSGVTITPPDHTTLLVELTCNVGDERWRGDESAIQEVIRDMETEELLRADEIEEVHVLNTEYGYPVFELGFEPHLDQLQDYVSRFDNLRSTGRQGGFCYPNMHTAMRMGAEAAEELLDELGQQVGSQAEPVG